MKELLGFIGVLALLWLIWFTSGGPKKYESTAGPFIKPMVVGQKNAEFYGSDADLWFWGPKNTPKGYQAFDPNKLPTSWKQVNTKFFYAYIPPTWTYEEKIIDDKYTGKFIGPTTTLAYEFGDNVNTLAQADDPGYLFKYDTIGTYRVKLLKPSAGRSGTTGAYYSKTFKKYKLSIFGENLTPAEEKTAFTIFYNIRFKLNP